MTPKDKSFLLLHWLEQPVSLDIAEAAPDRMSSTTLHISARGMWALSAWGACLHSVPHGSRCQLLSGAEEVATDQWKGHPSCSQARKSNYFPSWSHLNRNW